MTDDEINAVVSELLRERFKSFGFHGATVESQEDFDGSPIIRVTAHLKEGDVPSEKFTEALYDIRSKLIGRGEERFVFLDSMSPEDTAVDEDVE
jgi:hypothetical protein